MTVEKWCDEVMRFIDGHEQFKTVADEKLEQAIQIIRRQQAALKEIDDACEGTNETIVNALVDCDRIAGGEK